MAITIELSDLGDDAFNEGQSEPDVLFLKFANHCEQVYWRRIYQKQQHIRGEIDGLQRIELPPAVIAVIQPDGYKKWVEHPDYEDRKAALDLQNARISVIRNDRLKSLEQTVLNYLSFIRKWECFNSGFSRPFESVSEIFDFFCCRGRTFWVNDEDEDEDELDFEDWLNEWIFDVDLTVAQQATETDQSVVCYYFANFEDASDKAKTLALSSGLSTVLSRCAAQWQVAFYSGDDFGNGRTESALQDVDSELHEVDSTDNDEQIEEKFYDKDTEDARSEMLDEVSEYGWGLSRSDDEGWFYED